MKSGGGGSVPNLAVRAFHFAIFAKLLDQDRSGKATLIFHVLPAKLFAVSMGAIRLQLSADDPLSLAPMPVQKAKNALFPR